MQSGADFNIGFDGSLSPTVIESFQQIGVLFIIFWKRLAVCSSSDGEFGNNWSFESPLILRISRLSFEHYIPPTGSKFLSSFGKHSK